MPTYNANILPDVTGRDLGSDGQRWDAFLQAVQVGGLTIGYGSASTRAAVLAAYPSVAIGSIYLSTAGKMYLKVANAAASTDWQRVTATAAD